MLLHITQESPYMFNQCSMWEVDIRNFPLLINPLSLRKSTQSYGCGPVFPVRLCILNSTDVKMPDEQNLPADKVYILE